MLAVPREVYDAIVAHAIEGAPEEVCGVLAGAFDEHESTVEVIEQATNVAPAPEHEYAIDPAEQLELMDGLEARGYEVVGFYHSHPRGPAGPSATDAARASWPDRSYLTSSARLKPWYSSRWGTRLGLSQPRHGGNFPLD